MFQGGKIVYQYTQFRWVGTTRRKVIPSRRIASRCYRIPSWVHVLASQRGRVKSWKCVQVYTNFAQYISKSCFMDDLEQESQRVFQRRNSIARDIVYCVSKGRSRTPKSVIFPRQTKVCKVPPSIFKWYACPPIWKTRSYAALCEGEFAVQISSENTFGRNEADKTIGNET